MDYFFKWPEFVPISRSIFESTFKISFRLRSKLPISNLETCNGFDGYEENVNDSYSQSMWWNVIEPQSNNK